MLEWRSRTNFIIIINVSACVSCDVKCIIYGKTKKLVPAYPHTTEQTHFFQSVSVCLVNFLYSREREKEREVVKARKFVMERSDAADALTA
jgi:hypothetical protein